MFHDRETREQDAAVAAVRAYIGAGGYAPGDRIPPERKLIRDLGMSRATLRKALDVLERERAIWRHVGKGTFVSKPAHAAELNGFGDDVEILTQQLTPVRIMRARLCIESAIAREAAVNASPEAVDEINAAREAAVRAVSWEEYEAQDDRFHQAIARAADNALILMLFDQLNRVRRGVAWVNLRRETERPHAAHTSFAEHDRILSAIEARDPHAAHEAMRRHIGSVSARLFGDD